MAKKKINYGGIVWLLFIVLVLGASIYVFFKYSGVYVVQELESTSSDGKVTLQASFYNFGGLRQTWVSGQEATHVTFSLKASNTGSVDLFNIEVVNQNANLGNAFDNLPIILNFPINSTDVVLGDTKQECPIGDECDLGEDCIEGNCYLNLQPFAIGYEQNDVEFSLQLQGDYTGSFGETEQDLSNIVSIIYDIRIEETEPSYVKFRTDDLTYDSDSSIAYGTSCDGSDLVIYGEETSSLMTTESCEDYFDSILLNYIIGDLSYSGTNSLILGTRSEFSGTIYIGETDDDGVGCKWVRYSDSRTGTVSISSVSSTPSMELDC
ncbi:MAG: hypothetical protein KKF56_05450 [Nanoarchaeota archaeon]|nr:hypothetical protein [Nanoarchaeota archaeon]